MAARPGAITPMASFLRMDYYVVCMNINLSERLFLLLSKSNKQSQISVFYLLGKKVKDNVTLDRAQLMLIDLYIMQNKDIY